MRLVEARSRRLRFRYAVERIGEGGDRTPLAAGETVHVPTTPAGRATRLPERWLGVVAALVEAGSEG